MARAMSFPLDKPLPNLVLAGSDSQEKKKMTILERKILALVDPKIMSSSFDNELSFRC